MYYFIFSLVGALLFIPALKAEPQESHGVILMYHHVSEDTPPSTTISPKMFEQHMAYLQQHHTVVALSSLVNSIRNKQPLPENAVAITFDDGYENIFLNAHPILKRYGFTYTVFINPPLIDTQNYQLSWQQVAQMQQQGASFANHTSHHNHLLQGSQTQGWLARSLEDIESAEHLLQQKTGESLKYLAYPFGEYNQQLADKIASLGYTGFGQHSGAVSQHSDYSALPRIPAAGIYSNLETLKAKLNSLDMPVIELAIQDPQLDYDKRQPVQKVTVNTNDLRATQLACYFKGEALPISWQQNTFTLQLPKQLSVGRSRINCTAPSITQRGRYYWFSQPWFVPTEKGDWLN
ncbi:polysaccharide deacetylase family protein [Aliiglaciecola sp. LCG003]|uniref:polysaccharide deacetylase family protein n=1 Tax=Aliiglaciecola sp. LCG003 TaxID=3053655 RepID=UPI002574804D|nr:polysaccharide deacetylase family protein [Aliiglaciecola sp. LCG003]WJG09334.1 polysaccharide deacetylase family protein [Aliiglaciecola sp. LCG003]